MIMDRSRHARHFAGYMAWTCLALAVFGMAGCRAVSNFKHVYSDMARSWQHPTDHFKRKVVVVVRKSPAFELPAGMKTDPGAFFAQALSAALPDQCAKIVMEKSGSIKLPEGKSALDPDMIFSLCQKARQVGCNAVICCELNAFTPVKREKSGSRFFNLFSKTDPARVALEKQYPDIYTIKIDLFACSTLSGARFYQDRLVYHYDPLKTDISAVPAGSGIGDSALRKAFDVMADRSAGALCPAICDQIWAGFGISATADSITIHSGADVGLQAGTVLTVYSPGAVITSVNGEKYWMPGHRTGDVQMDTVSADTATGKVVSGAVGGVGSVLLHQGALP